ncbi:hypothetical protein BDR07DRAFT_1440641 [Suillus spraguei]|nr:hypothetical protein BDR07DRAFT_1440641 [Suillus spraguei]
MGALGLHSRKRQIAEREVSHRFCIHLDNNDTRRQACGRDIEVNFDVAVELEYTHVPRKEVFTVQR